MTISEHEHRVLGVILALAILFLCALRIGMANDHAEILDRLTAIESKMNE